MGRSATTLRLLGQWERLDAVLDRDAAGQDAAARLAQTLGSRLIQVRLPPGVNDAADLAPLAEGSGLFGDAIRKAVGNQIGRSESAAEYDVLTEDTCAETWLNMNEAVRHRRAWPGTTGPLRTPRRLLDVADQSVSPAAAIRQEIRRSHDQIPPFGTSGARSSGV
jgi:DNA primase